jgi:hypothetical protein
MITFKCTKKDCRNKDIEYNFFGDDNKAECGGCKSILTGTDLRQDPVIDYSINENPSL